MCLGVGILKHFIERDKQFTIHLLVAAEQAWQRCISHGCMYAGAVTRNHCCQRENKNIPMLIKCELTTTPGVSDIGEVCEMVLWNFVQINSLDFQIALFYAYIGCLKK